MPPLIYAGRFDPKFLGVAIRAKSTAEVQSFRLNDRSAEADIAILTALADEAVVSDLSRQTVLQHETRHFHDALLSPFGQAATRLRVAASYNGFIVGMLVKRIGKKANALPVPLQRWLVMPEAERTAYLAEAGRGRELRPPSLPVLARDDDLSEFTPGPMELPYNTEALITGCRLALSAYQLVADLWRSPYRRGQELVAPAIDIWETSALICQFAAVEENTNGDIMNRFSAWVHQRGPRAYREGLAVLDWFLTVVGWEPSLRNLLVVATWAQLGRFKSEMLASSPSDRLGRIVAAAQEGKRWSSDASFADIARGWDEVIETDSIGGVREASTDYQGFAAQAPGRYGQVPGLPELLGQISAAHQRMLAAFLDDLDGYVDPYTYLRQQSAYPAPCVGISYLTGPDSGTEWVDATPDDLHPAIDFDSALILTAITELADAIFLPGATSLQESGRYEIRARLDLEAIRII
jgi:hypothetical protein